MRKRAGWGHPEKVGEVISTSLGIDADTFASGPTEIKLLLPWSGSATTLGQLSDLLLENTDTPKNVSYLFHISSTMPHESDSYWLRGVVFLMFYLGAGLPRSPEVAKFIINAYSADQRRIFFSETMVRAAQHQSIELVKACLELGGEVNPLPSVSYMPSLPLNFAVSGKKIENVRLLLKAGADPRNDLNDGHGTAMSRAHRNKELDHSDQTLELLLDHCQREGLDPSVIRFPIQGEWRSFNRQEAKSGWLLSVGVEPTPEAIRELDEMNESLMSK